MMLGHGKLEEMTDEELIIALGGRSEWDWHNVIATPMDRDIALIQETLRRILKHITNEEIDT